MGRSPVDVALLAAWSVALFIAGVATGLTTAAPVRQPPIAYAQDFCADHRGPGRAGQGAGPMNGVSIMISCDPDYPATPRPYDGP
jgi:hypothetical protein